MARRKGGRTGGADAAVFADFADVTRELRAAGGRTKDLADVEALTARRRGRE